MNTIANTARIEIIEAIEDYAGHGVIDSTFTGRGGNNVDVWVMLDSSGKWAEKNIHVDYQPGNGWVVIGPATPAN